MSSITDAEYEALRDAATAAILESKSAKQLIVAGPGTGKTHAFKGALERSVAVSSGQRGVAVTFIRNLASDLQVALGDLAIANTFHGHCKHLMHSHNVAGLRDSDYYPALLNIIVSDIQILYNRKVGKRELKSRLHTFDESDGMLEQALQRANYYLERFARCLTALFQFRVCRLSCCGKRFLHFGRNDNSACSCQPFCNPL